jgi:5'-3' exonuclease
MGIPKFYRWLSQRYPLINQAISHVIPEYDNLYLDFNGIIHRCTHPDDSNPLDNTLTESDMIIKMFEYVQVSVTLILQEIFTHSCQPVSISIQMEKKTYYLPRTHIVVLLLG